MAKYPYNTPSWFRARERALARDGNSCTVARLLGGPCEGTLHVHHITPVEEGGALYELDNLATACASHHPRWEKLRREVLSEREPRWRRCHHKHRTRESRRLCEDRLNGVRPSSQLTSVA